LYFKTPQRRHDIGAAVLQQKKNDAGEYRVYLQALAP
jgi:hypothetical protein